jgi:hypothetical protein
MAAAHRVEVKLARPTAPLVGSRADASSAIRWTGRPRAQSMVK